MYSSLIFKKSRGCIEVIPLNTNCDRPIPMLLLCVNPSKIPKLYDKVVKLIGC